jgi:hypothetical protein
VNIFKEASKTGDCPDLADPRGVERATLDTG